MARTIGLKYGTNQIVQTTTLNLWKLRIVDRAGVRLHGSRPCLDRVIGTPLRRRVGDVPGRLIAAEGR